MTAFHADDIMTASYVTEAEITDTDIFIVKSGDDRMKVPVK